MPPQRTLAHALAFAQTFGSFDYLLERGIGGAFAAMAASKVAIIRQPDILYASYRDVKHLMDGVIVASRQNALISTMFSSGETRIFSDTLCTPDLARLRRAAKQAHSLLATLSFDYVVLLNSAACVVMVVEMRKNRRHAQLKLYRPPRAGRKKCFWTEMSRALVRELETRIPLHNGTGVSQVSFKSLGYQEPGKTHELGGERHFSGHVHY
jgi:hypothetical protein